RQLCNFIRRSRRVAAHHDDAGERILLCQAADHLPAFGVAFAGDGAGIDDAQIGGLVVGHFAVADLGQTITDVLSFVLVYLATERYGTEGGRHRLFSLPSARGCTTSNPCTLSPDDPYHRREPGRASALRARAWWSAQWRGLACRLPRPIGSLSRADDRTTPRASP